MVKTTNVAADGDKKVGVFVPEANLFLAIDPNMDINQIVQQLGPLSAQTISQLQQALAHIHNPPGPPPQP